MPGQQYQLPIKDQNVTDANLENIINQMASNNSGNNANNNNINTNNSTNNLIQAVKGRSETISMSPSVRQPQVQMQQVTILKEGCQFGEMALLNNQPRLATIQCMEDCIFGVLGKKDFKEVLKKFEEEKLHKEMSYFSSLPIFTQWNINQLKNLFLNSRKREYLRDQYIFQEGDPIDGIYIIKRGDFQQSKKFTRLQDIDGLNLDPDEIKIFDENEHLNKFEPFEKDMQICILDEKTIIGEEDIIKNNPKRTFSVKCTSLTGLAIRIDKTEFQYRVMLEESSKACLLKQLEIKEKAFNLRVKDIKSRLSQFQNYFYQNSKHKEYIRYKIESQSSKLFQSNSSKKVNHNRSKTIHESNDESKIRKYANSPFTQRELTTRTSLPSQITSFTEAIKVVPQNSQAKRMIRSLSSSNYLKATQTPVHSEPVENYKKVFMNINKANNTSMNEQNSIYDLDQLNKSNIVKLPPQSESKQEEILPKSIFSTAQTQLKPEKKGRSVSSYETNMYQIMKSSLQDQKMRNGIKDDDIKNKHDIFLAKRQKPLEESMRPRLLYGNIEQTIKVNFKKVFQKLLREKGINTDVKEIPTWNKVSLSFANQVLVYNSSDAFDKQRAVSAKKRQDYENLLETAHVLTRDLKKMNNDEEIVSSQNTSTTGNNNISEAVKQHIAEQQAKRRLIRSSSNPKRLIKVMRNFQSSQQNTEQSKLVEFTQSDSLGDSNEFKESYLRSIDYNSISRIHYSPKKTSSQFKSTLKIKKK